MNFPLALNMRDKFPINSEFRFHEGWAWKLFQAQWQQHNWQFFLFTDLVLAQLKAPRAPEMVMHKFGHLNVFPYIPTAFSQRRASFHLIWTELLWIKLFCFQSKAFAACQRQWVSAGIFFSSDTPLITFQLVLLFIHQLCWLWTSPYCHWGGKKAIYCSTNSLPFHLIFDLCIMKCSVKFAKCVSFKIANLFWYKI